MERGGECQRKKEQWGKGPIESGSTQGIQRIQVGSGHQSKRVGKRGAGGLTECVTVIICDRK